MLHICTWVWGTKYSDDYVTKLAYGVQRHMIQPHRWMVCRPEAEDLPLTAGPGCFARLRMFDPEWQQRNGVFEGDRLVCLDLDSIVTGPLDSLFDREEPFLILLGANASNPCPYNGSIMMLRGGYRPDVWTDFSFEAANKTAHYEYPDDQGWLWYKLPGTAGWKAGSASGVYAFQKPGWPGKSVSLPSDARLVVFPGYRDPNHYHELSWVQQHWRT